MALLVFSAEPHRLLRPSPEGLCRSGVEACCYGNQSSRCSGQDAAIQTHASHTWMKTTKCRRRLKQFRTLLKISVHPSISFLLDLSHTQTRELLQFQSVSIFNRGRKISQAVPVTTCFRVTIFVCVQLRPSERRNMYRMSSTPSCVQARTSVQPSVSAVSLIIPPLISAVAREIGHVSAANLFSARCFRA